MSSPRSALAAAVAFGGSKNELIMTACTVAVGLIDPGAEEQAVDVVVRRGRREGADVADLAVGSLVEQRGRHAQGVGRLGVLDVVGVEVVGVRVAVALEEVDVRVVGGDVGQERGVLGVGDHEIVVRARSSKIGVVCAGSNSTFSTYVPSTLSPRVSNTNWRPRWCSCVHPLSLIGPM